MFILYYIKLSYMNKSLLFIVLSTVAILFSSCKEKIQTTTALVKKTSDTTLVATIDKYDIVFDVKDSRCDNGAIMPGDSVSIHYVGDLRNKKAKAVLLTLIPQKGTIVEAIYDPSKELMTKPLSEEEMKRISKGMDYLKKHGH